LIGLRRMMRMLTADWDQEVRQTEVDKAYRQAKEARIEKISDGIQHLIWLVRHQRPDGTWTNDEDDLVTEFMIFLKGKGIYI
jgi:hypothetical protein